MKTTSLKVAEQFNMGNGTLVQKIEHLIRKYPDHEKHYKQKIYKTKRNRKYVMYSMDDKGYGILLDWKTRVDSIRKLKLELNDEVQNNELTDSKVINKSMELDKHIAKEQRERLVNRKDVKICGLEVKKEMNF